MSGDNNHCSHCGSQRTRCRRELFHTLMGGEVPGTGFDWYGERTPGACPPRSLFVTLLALFMGLALPAAGLWHFEHYPALVWLAAAAALLLAGLFVDVQITYRRYRRWAAQWVCADCRTIFSRQGRVAQPLATQESFPTY